MIEIAGFSCRLIRASRKSIRISVNGSGGICVSAPKRASMKQITEFVEANSEFIRSAVTKQQTRHDSGLFGSDTESPFLYYKGRKIPVCFTKTPLSTFNGEQFILPEGLTVVQYRKIITELYRPLAKSYITARAEELSAKVGLKYKQLRFAQNTSRWGSRSTTGTISFSVYLIATPPEYIDHVILHELAHVKEMNHSEKFYKILDGWEPEHRARQKELTDNYGKWVRKFKVTS